MIVAAMFLLANVGMDCDGGGPCKVRLAPGVVSTSGAYAIDLIFVLRDFIQRRIGIGVSVCAIVMGAALGGVLVALVLVYASALGLLVLGFVDLVVYTPLARRRFVAASCFPA